MRLGEFSHALKIVGASVSWRYNWDFTLSTLKTHILRLQSHILRNQNLGRLCKA